MSQGWKKIQANLLARARAEKKAVEEARNTSKMDKESSTTASPPAPSAPSAPALSTPLTSRSRTGGTDPVGLLAAHGRHGRHGPEAVVKVFQALVSNIIRKPWLKKMPDIVAKKEAKRARAASCPLSRSPPEGQISDDTSESFSSGTGSGSDSDSSSSNNSSNTTVIKKKGETKSKPDGNGGSDDGDGDVLLLNNPSLQSFQFVDDDVVEVDRVDNANSSARAAPTGQVGPTDQDQVGPTDVDNDVGVSDKYKAVNYESEDNCSGEDDPGEASTLPTPHFLHVFSGSLPPQLST
jgi:hypothetical protein